MGAAKQKRYGFGRSHRLSGRRAFERVFAARCRRDVGPISVLGRPNGLSGLRLGLVVSGKVGTAVVRNRIKRLLREAFRLGQHDWPYGYDLVVVVRAHQPATLADYQRLLLTGIRGVHLEWERRLSKPRTANRLTEGTPDRGAGG